MIIQDCVDRMAQISAIQGLVVAGSAAIELAPIAQDVLTVLVLREQIKLWCAGGLKRFGQGLLLIHQVRKSPAMTFGLIRQLIGTILGVRDQAVAAQGHHLNGLSMVLFEACELRFDVFHKRAV